MAEAQPAHQAPAQLDARVVAQWARLSASRLREQSQAINALNVFPIPDSDTGSNMAHTMTTAVSAVDALEEGASLPEVTIALATGAVRGARGNSGLVLSQVMRALAEAASQGHIDGPAVADTLSQSVGFVRTAISTPVEGTVISVLDAAATAAHEAEPNLADVATRALHAAEGALANTPNQLPVLAEAGVVDAGGQGLVVILQALVDVLDGAGLIEDAPTPDHERTQQEVEVMFFFEGNLDALRELLEAHGNSVIVGPLSPESGTAHVHTNRAGEVIEKAFALGTVTDLRIEVLPADGEAVESGKPSTPAPAGAQARAEDQGPFIVALTPTGGVAQLFEAAGAVAVASPNNKTLGEAVQGLGAGPIAVLTNGQDVAALQGLDGTREVDIIDTKSLVGGLAALAVNDPTVDWDDNVEEMIDAVEAQRFATCPPDTMVDTLSAMLADGGELVTLLWSAPATDQAAIEGLKATFAELYPDVQIDDHHIELQGNDHDPCLVQIGVE